MSAPGASQDRPAQAHAAPQEPDAAQADRRWMSLALEQAGRAAQAGEVPVGAVVVRDGVLLGSGRNSPIASHDPSAHAEINALRAAGAATGNYRLEGATLYVTLEPCAMCAGAMLHARLARVVFGAADPQTGAAGSVGDLFAQPQLNHRTKVDGGIDAGSCAALLHEFFRARRQGAKEAAQPLRDDALRTPASCFAAFDAHWPQTQAMATLPSLGGWRLCYADSSPGPDCDGTALLCLHGWGEWGYLFRHLAAHLQGHRVLVPDLIGFGRSDKPKRESAHTVAWHARMLAEWLQALGVSRVVVAHQPSMADLVQALAEEDRLRVAGTVAIAAGAADEQGQAAWRAPFPDRGFEAGRRAFGLRGVSRDDLTDEAARRLAVQLQDMAG